ncbi:limonene 1,2-monooxygenase [Nocardia kruczakiae]|uniref:Limonene 1,2-monooxygenase n=1 Tax=Nocardia kruczakiae TaxID=261477 RepID=A0ABU1XD72_9NOCA|nr:LLM class flavin-dependent oxidoreductase [Nocardia kruczakiae]MDR7168011.1 limonene 1,2-monooxygenase [Nocardia kruczakiae]
MLPTSFGCFTLPFHPPRQDPFHSLGDDIDLVLLAEELGFDEIWIGEHHAGGWGTLTAPDLLIAALARETRTIRLGTGVVPLPYHHPVHVAERILLLDNLTRGRTLLGCGPGAFVQDMEMIGVDPAQVRPHFAAALETVTALVRGETVDVRTPWFTAREAQLQLRPYRDPVEVVVASSLGDPAIEQLAGTGTHPLLNLTPPWGALRAGMVGDPIGQLAQRLAVLREHAAGPIRLNVFVHVSDSRESGIDEIFEGWMRQRLELYRGTLGMPVPGSESAGRSALEALIDAGAFIVGPPQSCVERITELSTRLGGLDTLILFVPGWVPNPLLERSLRAFAREVAPALRGWHAGVEKSLAAATAGSARRAEVRAAMANAPVSV